MLCSIEKESGEQVEDKKEQNLQQESFFFFSEVLFVITFLVSDV
jgi:hypothetical protein